MNGRKSPELARAELVEFMRYAKLESGDVDLSNEFSVAVHSTWYLLDPLSLGSRRAIGSDPPFNGSLSREQQKSTIKFTSHAHEKEPQTASPDDLLVYSAICSDGNKKVNFITDRFICKKIL